MDLGQFIVLVHNNKAETQDSMDQLSEDKDAFARILRATARDQITNNNSVRCFCNLPACVSTGYMCKSSTGGCFSDFYQHSESSPYRGNHGCLELLTDKSKQDYCQINTNSNQNPVRKQAPHARSLLQCCYHDMCNHADDPHTKDLINDTSLANTFNEDNNRITDSQLENAYNSSEVWFKAATIAVPICGAVILFVLIALAVKLLKGESLNSSNHKLGCSYTSPQEKKNFDKHHEHYQTSQSLLPHQNHIFSNQIVDVRRHLHSPIIIKKDLNDVNNVAYFNNTDYNLLTRNPQIFETHRFYDNSNLLVINNEEHCHRLNILKNSCPEIGFSEASTNNDFKDKEKIINKDLV